MAKSVISDGKNALKNILIAVTTTVIGSTAIYFLGFNNKKKLTALEREEITLDAWKSYATVENIYAKNTISMLQDAIKYGRCMDILNQSLQESAEFTKSIEEFISTDGVDKDFVAMLKNRLAVEKSSLPMVQNFYTGLDKLMVKAVAQSWPPPQKKDSATKRAREFVKQIKNTLAPTFTSIEVLSKELSEKYDQPFETGDFLALQAARFGKNIFDLPEKGRIAPPDNNIVPEQKAEDPDEPASLSRKYLTGKWSSSGIIINFHGNGRVDWFVLATGKTISGTWQLKDEQLLLRIGHHPITGETRTSRFLISKIIANSFSMRLVDSIDDIYNMQRM